MKKNYFIITLLIVFLVLITGCEKEPKENNIYDNLIINKLTLTKIDKCKNKLEKYYEKDGRTIYVVCLSDVKINVYEDTYDLKDYLDNTNDTFEQAIHKLAKVHVNETQYDDGGTILYYNNKTALLRCNTLDNNKDIYIGDNTLTYENDYCK